ncbi:hypothetical protein FRC12_022836 [Ceratobasidium sp. 428]|nr:hypothetical protein FRC12_022836 [Ceratobasidium sp. 428]
MIQPPSSRKSPKQNIDGTDRTTQRLNPKHRTSRLLPKKITPPDPTPLLPVTSRRLVGKGRELPRADHASHLERGKALCNQTFSATGAVDDFAGSRTSLDSPASLSSPR